jgi:hypothetical protein
MEAPGSSLKKEHSVADAINAALVMTSSDAAFAVFLCSADTRKPAAPKGPPQDKGGPPASKP